MYAIVNILQRVRISGRVNEPTLADIRGQEVRPDRVQSATEDFTWVTECYLTIGDIFMFLISNFIFLIFLINSQSG